MFLTWMGGKIFIVVSMCIDEDRNNAVFHSSSFIQRPKHPHKLNVKLDTSGIFSTLLNIYDETFCENS